MPKLKLICLGLIIASTIVACKKSPSIDANGNAVVPGSVPYVQSSGLYISGYTQFRDTVDAANVWKDGMVFSLPTPHGITNHMVASGSDVYVIGFSGVNGVIWKNGVVFSTFIPPSGYGRIDLNGIAIVGSDVYVSGEITGVNLRSKPVYWKNNTINFLYDDLAFPFGASTSGITVIGTDVYVCGSKGGYAIYWKNGTSYTLGVGRAVDITTSGTDVYILCVGRDPNNQFNTMYNYWKNGTPVYLPTYGTTGFSEVHAIKIHGSDVYVSGVVSNSNGVSFAAYAKNGIITNIGTSFPNGSSAYGMCFDNSGNMYIAGNSRTSDLHNPVATYWKNGTPTVLSTQPYSFATDIVYVQ